MLFGAGLMLLIGTPSAAGDRWFKPRHAEVGAPIYQAHCAGCHGRRGEGAAGWQQPNTDGSYPPPPLNGTGHAWHHPLRNLYGTIANGQGNMPAWKTSLRREEILAIIAWFQSQWSDEIYAAWRRMDRENR